MSETLQPVTTGFNRSLRVQSGADLDGVGDAHGWYGNLHLFRNLLVQEVHQLVLPGFEPRHAGDGCADRWAACAGGERTSGVVARFARRTGARADEKAWQPGSAAKAA